MHLLPEAVDDEVRLSPPPTTLGEPQYGPPRRLTGTAVFGNRWASLDLLRIGKLHAGSGNQAVTLDRFVAHPSYLRGEIARTASAQGCRW
jgi:hypothetical protein